MDLWASITSNWVPLAAAVGFLLSIINSIPNVIKISEYLKTRKANKPDFTFEIEKTILHMHDPKTNGSVPTPMLHIKLENIGETPFKITKCEYGFGNKIFYPIITNGKPFKPYISKPGVETGEYISLEKIIKQAKEAGFSGNVDFYAYCVDEFNKRHTSKPFLLNLN